MKLITIEVMVSVNKKDDSYQPLSRGIQATIIIVGSSRRWFKRICVPDLKAILLSCTRLSNNAR